MRATRKAIRCAIGRFNGGFGVADLLCSWSSLDAANDSVPPPLRVQQMDVKTGCYLLAVTQSRIFMSSSRI